MMTPKHHPSDALLMAYAAGSLGEGLSLVVAAHLQLCPDCRRTVAAAEALGGALFEELAPEAMDGGALERMLTRLDEPAPPAASRPPAPAHPDGLALPEPLRSRVGGVGHARWRRLAPGMRQIEVMPRGRRGGSVRLLRIAPGMVMPHHGHTGIELTLILAGSYSDEMGRYGPGDLAETDGETRHQPVSDGDEDCVCVIATEAPLRFTGLIPRLMQPFFGI